MRIRVVWCLLYPKTHARVAQCKGISSCVPTAALSNQQQPVEHSCACSRPAGASSTLIGCAPDTCTQTRLVFLPIKMGIMAYTRRYLCGRRANCVGKPRLLGVRHIPTGQLICKQVRACTPTSIFIRIGMTVDKASVKCRSRYVWYVCKSWESAESVPQILFSILLGDI